MLEIIDARGLAVPFFLCRLRQTDGIRYRALLCSAILIDIVGWDVGPRYCGRFRCHYFLSAAFDFVIFDQGSIGTLEVGNRINQEIKFPSFGLKVHSNPND